MAASRPNIPWRILIVEDDPIIGMMLQDMLMKLHCVPVGPAGSVAAALALIDETPSLHGAVLDCNLGAEDVWPVAHRLFECKVPFVFSTGYGHTGIAARFVGVPVLNKPYSASALERMLIPQLRA